jgi:hypothetical protein
MMSDHILTTGYDAHKYTAMLIWRHYRRDNLLCCGLIAELHRSDLMVLTRSGGEDILKRIQQGIQLA